MSFLEGAHSLIKKKTDMKISGCDLHKCITDIIKPITQEMNKKFITKPRGPC